MGPQSSQRTIASTPVTTTRAAVLSLSAASLSVVSPRAHAFLRCLEELALEFLLSVVNAALSALATMVNRLLCNLIQMVGNVE